MAILSNCTDPLYKYRYKLKIALGSEENKDDTARWSEFLRLTAARQNWPCKSRRNGLQQLWDLVDLPTDAGYLPRLRKAQHQLTLHLELGRSECATSQAYSTHDNIRPCFGRKCACATDERIALDHLGLDRCKWQRESVAMTCGNGKHVRDRNKYLLAPELHTLQCFNCDKNNVTLMRHSLDEGALCFAAKPLSRIYCGWRGT